MLKFGKPTTADTWAEFDQQGQLFFFDEDAARKALTASPDPGVRGVARLVLSVLDAERKRITEDQWPDYIEEKEIKK